ncbi:glucose-6-phosphate isomerase [Candidatus Sumerlaeota bacterium]|nr:glucose-6-phosphate isomerase [Candidatus Sumerlaeota bacterium]
MDMGDFKAFCDQYCATDASPLVLDYGALGISNAFLDSMETRIQAAFDAMEKLEKGAIANPDENRMVGHYWLRDLDRIPDAKLRDEVKFDDAKMRRFVADVHSGKIKAQNGGRFSQLLVVGIGGSALGPQLVADALGTDAEDEMTPHFLDNTDPEGIARVLARLGDRLAETLVVVISKSGGTPETRNGMLLVEAAYRDAGLNFGAHAVAVTGINSKLDQYAMAGKWLVSLPMYDWVGGRTSVMSAVGLLPAALQGIDIDAFLKGARAMDLSTRSRKTRENPAALLALGWHFATGGAGRKDMVVLPYRDRLLLFSRYLQQLVMESLGKEKDLKGQVVEQGIAVYGNKGSTDQHAYVQQLRDGVNNFFAVFVEVLTDGGDKSREVEPGVTAGDYLQGFLQGTRRALSEKSRGSMTIIAQDFGAHTLGALIALFERAVGLYATLVNINAYHQPGVEAGKKAAAEVLDAQAKLLAALKKSPGEKSAGDWATAAGVDAVMAFRILQHLAFNGRGVTMKGRHPATATFR